MPPNKHDVLGYRSPTNLKLVGIIALVVVAGVAVVGIVGRVHANQNVKEWTREQQIPTVGLVIAKADNTPAVLTLPAQVQAFQNAGIHSRVPGYLKAWHVDIGQPVKRGQLLAEVDTPDLDQQLAAARADLATARANASLSSSTAARWKNLLAKDAVSQQEYDEKAGDALAKASVVNAAAANVSRLQATSAFKRIVAPFDGVITTRSTDIGTLISAGNPNEPPLFTVSQIDKLRIYVNVPQNYSAQIHKGMTATLSAPERPDETATATVVGDAQAISAQGSLLVQLQLDNHDGKLKAGSYVQAKLQMKGGPAVARIPSSALITGEHGNQVATVGPDNKVVLRQVTIGRDFGSSMDIASGIAPNEKIIDNPPDDLAQGDLVKVAPPKPEKVAKNG